MAESEQTQVIQPKKKMGFGKKLIIILAVIVAFLGVCSLMIVHQNNQLEKKFYQVKSNKNTQIFNRNMEYSNEAHYIESKLSQYLYDFPSVEREKFSVNNMIL